MKKVLSIPLILLISFIALVGCGSKETGSQAGDASSNGGELEVGVILKALNSDYWKFVEAGAKAAGEKYGVTVNVLGPPAETQFMEQVSMMEDQLTQGVDALLVAPSQPASAKPVFEQAKASDIPVLLLDTDADFEDKVSFIGTGNYEAGRLGGEFIIKQVKKGDTVAVIRGVKGDNTHDDRTKGAEEVLKEKGIKVVVQPADSDRAKAANVMENILTAHPNVTAVYATSEEMALGALRTVQDKNRDVLVIGFDGTPEGLESIKNGGLTATIAQDPYMIGYLGVESTYKNAKGEKVEKRIDSGAEVITDEITGNYETTLNFNFSFDTDENQVVKLEASSGIEVYSNGTAPYGLHLIMGFRRNDAEEGLYSNFATLTNIVQEGYQRIPLAITLADFPPPGQHTYTLEIFAAAGGASIDQGPAITPISFVITHIQLRETK